MKAFEFVKRNFIFVLIAIAVMFILGHKYRENPTSIIMHANDFVDFGMDNEYFSQTWQPTAKRMTGVTVPYISKDSFEGDFRLEIWNAHQTMLLDTFRTHQVFTEGEEGRMYFDTGAFVLAPGNRYTFRFYPENIAGDYTISLWTKDNYDGGYIVDTPIDGAINLEIEQHIHTTLYWMLTSFGTALAIAFLLMVAFGKKTEDTIGLAYMIIGITLYVFGLFDKLESGVGAVYILSIVAFAAGIIIYNLKKLSLKNLVSPGLFVYGFFVLVIIYTCRGAGFSRYDEFYHWGLAAKDMFYFNSFATHDLTTVTLDSYPPMSTLMEYFFMYNNGLFSEGILYVGFQVFMLSALTAALKPVVKRTSGRILTAILDVVVLMCIPVISFGWNYYTIYVDGLLAILMAYVLLCYYTEEMNIFNVLRIVAGLCVLTLTKDMGLLLSFIAVFIIAGDILLIKKKYRLSIPVFGLVSVVSYIAWKMRVAHMIGFNHVLGAELLHSATKDISCVGSGVTFAPSVGALKPYSGLGLTGLAEIVTGQAPDYRYETIRTFFKIMFIKPVLSTDKWFIPYVWAILLVIVFLYLSIIRLNSNKAKDNMATDNMATDNTVKDNTVKDNTIKDNYEEKEVKVFMLFAFIAAVMYALVMLVCYLFLFPEDEAVVGYSMDRYLCSYIGALLILTYMFLRNIRLKEILGRLENKASVGQTIGEKNTGEKNAEEIITVDKTEGVKITVDKSAGEKTVCEKNVGEECIEGKYTGNKGVKSKRISGWENYIGLTAFIILVLVGTPYKEMFTDKSTAFDASLTQGAEEIGEAFRSFAKAQEKVFVWCNWSTGTSPMYYKNILCPSITNTENYDIVPSYEWYEANVEDKWGTPNVMSCEDLKSFMKGMYFNYVLILNPYDCVGDYYGELFEDTDTIRKGAYYRVVREDEDLKLRYIGAVDIGWTM